MILAIVSAVSALGSAVAGAVAARENRKATEASIQPPYQPPASSSPPPPPPASGGGAGLLLPVALAVGGAYLLWGRKTRGM